MTNEQAVSIEISKIKGVNKAPKPSTDYQALLNSIRENEKNCPGKGVQSPIAINKDSFQIITGHSRVLACIDLDMTTVPAVLLPWEPQSPEARLYAIDSDLVHAKLSIFEECILLAERKSIFVKQHPETAKGIAGALAKHGGATVTVSFAKTTAAKTGKNRRTIERRAEIGEKVAPQLKEPLLYPTNPKAAKLANSQKDLDYLVKNKKNGKARPHDEQIAGFERLMGMDTPTMKHFDTASHISRAFMQLEREQYVNEHEKVPFEGKEYKLWHGDFKDVCKNIPDNSIAAIVTDVPWDGTFLKDVPAFAEVAARVLKDCGHIAILPGQQTLMEFYAIMYEFIKADPRLRFRWEWSITSPKGSHCRKVGSSRTITHSKPIAIFSKGDSQYPYDTLDTIYSEEGPEKFWHGWQQPVPDMEQIILRLTDMGDTVLDVCNGGGSTGVAALKNHRLYIGCDIELSCIESTRVRFHKEFGDVLLPIQSDSLLLTA